MPTELQGLTRQLRAARRRLERRANRAANTPPATQALAVLLALLAGGDVAVAAQWLADEDRRRANFDNPAAYYAPRVVGWVEELSDADRAERLAGTGPAGQWRVKRARDLFRRYQAVSWIVDVNSACGAAPGGGASVLRSVGEDTSATPQ